MHVEYRMHCHGLSHSYKKFKHILTLWSHRLGLWFEYSASLKDGAGLASIWFKSLIGLNPTPLTLYTNLRKSLLTKASNYEQTLLTILLFMVTCFSPHPLPHLLV